MTAVVSSPPRRERVPTPFPRRKWHTDRRADCASTAPPARMWRLDPRARPAFVVLCAECEIPTNVHDEGAQAGEMGYPMALRLGTSEGTERRPIVS